jgi:two-component system response regulator FlrC
VPPAPLVPAVLPPSRQILPTSAAAGGERPANMKDLEREHILKVLREVGGSRKRAVAQLGISERTLRYKLQQYREEGLFSG